MEFPNSSWVNLQQLLDFLDLKCLFVLAWITVTSISSGAHCLSPSEPKTEHLVHLGILPPTPVSTLLQANTAEARIVYTVLYSNMSKDHFLWNNLFIIKLRDCLLENCSLTSINGILPGTINNYTMVKQGDDPCTPVSLNYRDIGQS